MTLYIMALRSAYNTAFFKKQDAVMYMQYETSTMGGKKQIHVRSISKS